MSTPAQAKKPTATTSAIPNTPQIDPDGPPPMKGNGEFDTAREGAAATAANKALFPGADTKERIFGGVTFRIRHLKLRRERVFLELFPVLRTPFDRFQEMARAEEGAVREAREVYADEIAALEKKASDLLERTSQDLEDAVAERLNREYLASQARLVEINALVQSSRVGPWRMIIDLLATSGDEVVDTLARICATILDNAKPESFSQEITPDWIGDYLSVSEIAEVVTAQISEQNWGNFLQRAVGTVRPPAAA